MANKSNIFYISVILWITSLISCGESNRQEDFSYDIQATLTLRQEKNAYFLNSPDSPLTEEDISNRSPLSYFPPDQSYIVRAVLVPAKTKDTIVMSTTKDTVTKKMKLMGAMTFALKDNQYKLNAYIPLKSLEKNPDGPYYLFIPFTDLTNGKETYAGGRYIDIPLAEGFEYLIDFNEAYNPYCAYNKSYTCPIVPESNHISIEVEAGEKKFVSIDSADHSSNAFE